MLEARLIPIMLIEHGRLVKTIAFDERIYVGDPINTLKIFNDKMVDEVIVLDIGTDDAGIELSFLDRLVSEAFMPLTYGGGIRTPRDASDVLQLGFEKVALRRMLVEAPEQVRDVVARYGSQAVVGCLDVDRSRDSYRVWSGREFLPMPLMLQRLQECRVGEVLVQSMQDDGSGHGLNLDLLRVARGALDSPLIIAGGLRDLSDFADALRAGADAVAGGAFFVFRGRRRAVLVTYPSPEALEEARQYQGE